MAVQIGLPAYMWQLTAACYAALATAAVGHQANQLVDKYRPGNSHGDPKALWKAFEELSDPTQSQPLLVQELKDLLREVKLVPTGNPHLDLEQFASAISAQTKKINNVSGELHWSLSASDITRLYRNNIPKEINQPGITMLIDFKDPNKCMKQMLHLAAEYNATHGISMAKSLLAAGTPHAHGHAAQSDQKPSHLKGKSACDYAGHSKPKGWVGTYWCQGHNRADCAKEAADKANGDPKGGHHNPGPKQCFGCGKYGHVSAQCPTHRGKFTYSKKDSKGGQRPTGDSKWKSYNKQRKDLRDTKAALATAEGKLSSLKPVPAAAAAAAAPVVAPAPAPASAQQHVTLPAAPKGMSYFLGAAIVALSMPTSAAQTAMDTSVTYMVPPPASCFATYDGTDVYNGSDGFADTGATFSVLPLARYQEDPSRYIDWTLHDPLFIPPQELSYGNGTKDKILFVVGEYRWFKDVKTGDWIERLFGPELVCAGAVYHLISPRDHVRLHPGSALLLDADGMRMIYADGTAVVYTENNGMFEVPSSLPPPTQQQLQQQQEQHRNNTALANVLLHSSTEPSEDWDSTWLRMLTGLGYDNASARDECHLHHEYKVAVGDATIKARSESAPSKRFDMLSATWGYQGKEKIQMIAEADDITITGRDRHFNIAKFYGSAVSKPAYRPVNSEPFCTPHKRYAVGLDDVGGLPPSHRRHHTGVVIVTGSTAVTRAYPSQTLTTDDCIKALDKYLIDGGWITPQVCYGPQVIRTDRAKVFDCSKFDDYRTRRKAKHIMSAPFDGKFINHWIEGEIRICFQMMLSMLWSMPTAGLNLDPLLLWDHALEHGCNLRYLTPQRKLGKLTPHEIETGRPADRSIIKGPFGCQVGVVQYKDTRLKLDRHIRLGIYLGQADRAYPNSCKVLMLDTKNVVVSQSVLFHPFPTTRVMPTVYDFNLEFGDIVWDPQNETMMKVIDPAELPPPPRPPPLQNHNAFTSYQRLDMSALEPPPPPPQLSPPQQDADVKVDSVPPAHHFHVGMQVDIDYADEGMWPATIVQVWKKQVQVQFDTVTNDADEKVKTIFKSDSFDSIIPTLIPRPTDTATTTVAQALTAASTATRAIFEAVVANTTSMATALVSTASVATRSIMASTASTATSSVVTLHTIFKSTATLPLLAAAALIYAVPGGSNRALLGIAHKRAHSDSIADIVNTTNADMFDDDSDWQQLAHAFAAQPQMSFKQALQTPDRAAWIAAGDDEMSGLQDSGTWSLIPITDIPANCELIDTKLFMTEKRDANGNLARRKGRLVCRGDQSTFGVGYFYTNGPTPTFDALRVFLSVGCMKDMDIKQYDFKQAFVSTDLDNDNTCIRLESHYRQYQYSDGTLRSTETHAGETGIEMVGHLHKSLYGLANSFANMNKAYDRIATAGGFICSEIEPSIHVKVTERGEGLAPHVTMALIYVDDLLVASTPNNPDEKDLLRRLRQEFTVTGGDDLDYYLGGDVVRHRQNRTMTIDQRQFIKDICNCYLGTAPRLSTPTMLPPKFKPTKADCPQTEAEQLKFKANAKKYRTTVGQLLYVYRYTRPDIGDPMSVLGRFTANPGPVHVKALRHLCHYLMNTIDVCIEYGPIEGKDVNVLEGYEKFLESTPETDENVLVGYTDADYASCVDTRRSQSGSIFMLNGGPVAWMSKKQPVVAMSSFESELISLTSGSLIAVYLRGLLVDLQTPQLQPTTMHEDNKATISAALNKSISHASRHIATRFFKIKELIADAVVYCKWVPSKWNKADFLTKNVDAATLDRSLKTTLGRRFD